MTAKIPITMPSIVNPARILFVDSARHAIRKLSGMGNPIGLVRRSSSGCHVRALSTSLLADDPADAFAPRPPFPSAGRGWGRGLVLADDCVDASAPRPPFPSAGRGW